MVTTPSKSITLENFLELPETKPPSEYIDGKNIEKPILKENTAQYRLNYLLRSRDRKIVSSQLLN